MNTIVNAVPVVALESLIAKGVFDAGLHAYAPEYVNNVIVPDIISGEDRRQFTTIEGKLKTRWRFHSIVDGVVMYYQHDQSYLMNAAPAV